MKKFLIVASLVLVALQTSAQKEYNFTAKVGVGLASVVGGDADTKVFVAAKAGLSYDLRPFEKGFSAYNQAFGLVLGYRF